MRAGEFNTLVTVERKGEDHGLGIKLKYEPTGTQAWVSIEELTGTELVAAQQLEARANLKLKTHWTAEIRVSDRLVDEASGRTFNIVAANNFENKYRELQLTCIEVVKP